jgi:hypothetical protein
MITSARVEALRAHSGIDWVTALRATEIKKLVVDGVVKPSLRLPEVADASGC